MSMTGAMSAAISGMKTHMQALNVVGNNIANVNTYGYKAQRVTFKESIYNTLSAGSGATTTMGGTNPQQIGYGCSVGTIDLDMSTGDLSPTGLATDCAIKGDGFFLVGPNGQNIDSMDDVKGLSLTRVGNFEFRNGYLVDKTSGNLVYGFLTSSLDNPTAGGAAGTAVGNASTALAPIRLPMKSTAADTMGDAVYVGVDADTGKNVDPTTDVDGFIDYENLSIDANGKITCTNKDTGDPVVVGYLARGTVDNPNGLLHTDGPYYTAGDAAGDITLSAPNSAVTGYLNNGKIENAAGDTDPATMLSAKSGTGIMTSYLEGSGTDLATEFSNMIVYQRGYQANTRIISVTDSMLEELVNIKR